MSRKKEDEERIESCVQISNKKWALILCLAGVVFAAWEMVVEGLIVHQII